MVRSVMKDPLFLSRKSPAARRAEPAIAQDLRDTLAAHRAQCVGMAANMIGELCRVIIIAVPGGEMILYNPEILQRSGAYEAEEGCLSLPGTRKVTRYRTVQVRYRDEDFREHTRVFFGQEAQILQHELDHCDGVLI